jgi:hypothetical protein
MLYLIAMKDTCNYIYENCKLAIRGDRCSTNCDNIKRYETRDGKRWRRVKVTHDETELRFGESAESSPVAVIKTISPERAGEILKKNREKYV